MYYSEVVSSPTRPLNARLEPELDAFVTEYQRAHKLPTRSDVIREALRALQQRERERELREGYRRLALEHAQDSDPWVDSDLGETLEAIDRGTGLARG